MAQTYFITGGAGNIARQLAGRFTQQGDRVVLFDMAQRPDDDAIKHCTYIRGDLTSRQVVDDALGQTKPTIILHMASLLSGRCEQSRPDGWQVNVAAAFELYETALSHGITGFFFPSSLASFGGELPAVLPEDHDQWPRGLYGVTKATCERLGHYYHHGHGLDFRCLRLPMVISRYAHTGAASAYASLVFIEAVRCGRFTFKVNPTTRVSTIYIPDVLEAIQQLVEAPAASLTRRCYNIQSFSPSAQELADAVIARVPGVRIDFEPDAQVAALIESWPGQMIDDSARRDWGWSPQFDLDRMADDFVGKLHSG